MTEIERKDNCGIAISSNELIMATYLKPVRVGEQIGILGALSEFWEPHIFENFGSPKIRKNGNAPIFCISTYIAVLLRRIIDIN